MSPAGTHLFQAVGPLRAPPPLRPPPRCAARATSRPLGRAATRPLEARPSPCLPVSSARDRRHRRHLGGDCRHGPRCVAGETPVGVRRARARRAPGRVRRDARPALPDAVAASCAIPGFFAPVEIGGEAFVDGGAHSPSNADVLLGADVGLVLVSSRCRRRGDGRVWHSTSPVDDGHGWPSIRGRGASADQARTCWPSSDARRSGGDRAQPDGPDPARSRGTPGEGVDPSPACAQRTPDTTAPAHGVNVGLSSPGTGRLAPARASSAPKGSFALSRVPRRALTSRQRDRCRGRARRQRSNVPYQFTDEGLSIQAEVARFLDEHVYPAEQQFLRRTRRGGP